eukprot:scaffold584_cov338-Pavlova_lutheri.AAC.16
MVAVRVLPPPSPPSILGIAVPPFPPPPLEKKLPRPPSPFGRGGKGGGAFHEVNSNVNSAWVRGDGAFVASGARSHERVRERGGSTQEKPCEHVGRSEERYVALGGWERAETSVADARTTADGRLSSPTAHVRTPGKQSEFAKRASKIGMQIHSTSQKLAKLAQLAKRTSMFDDPEREITELTTVIRQDITVLNGSLAELQGISVGQEGGSKSKQNVDHSATVVKNLQSKLMDTTKEFQNVLTLRKENVKSHENRRRMFSRSEKRGELGSKSGMGTRESFSPDSKELQGLFQPPPKGSLQSNGSNSSIAPTFEG